MVERDVECSAAFLDQLTDAGDTPEMLRPHVAVDLEAGHDAVTLADLSRPEISLRDIVVGDRLAGNVKRPDLDVLDLRAELARDPDMPFEQRLIAPKSVVEPAGP